MNNYLTGSETPPVQADFFILWQKKIYFSAPPYFHNLIICCLCFSTEVPEGGGRGGWCPDPISQQIVFFKSHNPSLSVAQIEIPFPFFYCFSFMNPIHSTQNPISQPLKKANPSSHLTLRDPLNQVPYSIRRYSLVTLVMWNQGKVTVM